MEERGDFEIVGLDGIWDCRTGSG